MLATLIALAMLNSAPGVPTPACPSAQFLPQLVIDAVHDPAVPVVDAWQVFLRGAPISDAQLTHWAGAEFREETLRTEMQNRGSWVYLGMLVGAAGTAVSSAGWVLYGQNNLSQTVTLSMAIGGLAVGIAGLLGVAEFIQTPLEPYLAPTPRHRFTRQEARDLVVLVNQRLQQEICEASAAKNIAP